MNGVSLRVTVPACSFRKAYAREFLESERVPPPATVYGFLLSLIGEEDRSRYIGSEIAVAVVNVPEVSTVLRTIWRVKKRVEGPGKGSNKRPDYQEILTGLEFGVWIKPGPLAEQLCSLKSPENICRFGGLSLGESRDLVNDIDMDPAWHREDALWLTQDEEGEYPLPVWVDHVGSKGTVWGQFNLTTKPLTMPEAQDNRWIQIRSPELCGKT